MDARGVGVVLADGGDLGGRRLLESRRRRPGAGRSARRSTQQRPPQRIRQERGQGCRRRTGRLLWLRFTWVPFSRGSVGRGAAARRRRAAMVTGEKGGGKAAGPPIRGRGRRAGGRRGAGTHRGEASRAGSSELTRTVTPTVQGQTAARVRSRAPQHPHEHEDDGGRVEDPQQRAEKDRMASSPRLETTQEKAAKASAQPRYETRGSSSAKYLPQQLMRPTHTLRQASRKMTATTTVPARPKVARRGLGDDHGPVGHAGSSRRRARCPRRTGRRRRPS